MLDFTWTLAMRSAACTVWRMVSSASSRSLITPAFSPCERWWPMPRICPICVRPRNEAFASIGSSRATRHTTLFVPMSSTETTELFLGPTGLTRGVSP